MFHEVTFMPSIPLPVPFVPAARSFVVSWELSFGWLGWRPQAWPPADDASGLKAEKPKWPKNLYAQVPKYPSGFAGLLDTGIQVIGLEVQRWVAAVAFQVAGVLAASRLFGMRGMVVAFCVNALQRALGHGTGVQAPYLKIPTSGYGQGPCGALF